jgi:hypothetical protein
MPSADKFFDFLRYEPESETRQSNHGFSDEESGASYATLPAIEPLGGSPRTGVDTLRLLYPLRLTRVPDFRVLTKREVKKSRFGEHPLWVEEDGKRRWGVMAVRRSGAFRFRIAPVRPGGPALLRVFFSAPRAHFGHNGSTLTQCDLIDVLEGMEKTLKGLGVAIDWREGQVCRLDVCRDALLPHPFHYYSKVLRLIWPRYNRLCQNYPSGIVRGSATRCVFTQYDKRIERQLRESQSDGGGNNGRETPFSTWLRTECRLPTAAAVRERSGIESVLDLVARYNELTDWMDERISKELMPVQTSPFVAFPCEPRETLGAEEELWWQSQLHGPAVSLKDRLALMGLRLLMETMQRSKSEPEVWALLRDWCSDENANLSSLRAEMRAVSLNGYSDEMLPIAQLYTELRAALLCASTAAESSTWSFENHSGSM